MFSVHRATNGIPVSGFAFLQSALSLANFCGSFSIVAYRRRSRHWRSKFSAISCLLIRDGASKLRQFLASEKTRRFKIPPRCELRWTLMSAGVGIRFWRAPAGLAERR
jgi:hypothetical protein